MLHMGMGKEIKNLIKRDKRLIKCVKAFKRNNKQIEQLAMN